jgi:PII-like signaling protein
MQIPEKASLLRIFIGEDDKANGRPLYEAIVLKAREAHLAGATVLRGSLGFGRSSMLHTAKLLVRDQIGFRKGGRHGCERAFH